MNKEDLLERYAAYADESLYTEAKLRYEEAIAVDQPGAATLCGYGYLQDCHGRNAIRAAVEYYQRAIDADPNWVKPHLHLISALAGLGELDMVIPRYEQRVAAAPGDARAYRLLSLAYLAAHAYDQATQALRAGLELAPGDAALVEQQGDLHAATGRPDEALRSWQRAYELAPDDYGISMRYSAAYLLEREGRLDEAAAEWRFILDWCDRHEAAIEVDWSRRELHRVQARQRSG